MTSHFPAQFHRRLQQLASFTLVELLVVMTIIAVLAALFLPALSSAQARAKTLTCANNLHQLGILYGVYATDNKGRLPVYSIPSMSPPSNSAPEWAYAIYPYVTPRMSPGPRNYQQLGLRQKIFDCPTTTALIYWSSNGIWPIRWFPGVFDYVAVNARRDFGGGYTILTGLWAGYRNLDRMPAKAIVLMERRETSELRTELTGGADEVGHISYHSGIYNSPAQIPVGFHHKNGMNFLLADLRVEWHGRGDYQPGYESNPLAIIRSSSINGVSTFVAEP